jgi:deoxyribose-phosphate aldolase
VQVKASGGVRNLDGLVAARDLGATRCGTSATAAILDEYHRRETGEMRRENAASSASSPAAKGDY